MMVDVVSTVVSAVQSGFDVPWIAVTSRPDCKSMFGGCYGSVAVFDEVVVKRWDEEDCGYETWLAFVLADDGKQSYSQNLPKIIWHSFELRMVILERLWPTDGIRVPGTDYPLCFASCSYCPERLANCPQWVQDLYPRVEELVASDDSIRFDGHGGNWMQRADGTKVVTDPLAPICSD